MDIAFNDYTRKNKKPTIILSQVNQVKMFRELWTKTMMRLSAEDEKIVNVTMLDLYRKSFN